MQKPEIEPSNKQHFCPLRDTPEGVKVLDIPDACIKNCGHLLVRGADDSVTLEPNSNYPGILHLEDCETGNAKESKFEHVSTVSVGKRGMRVNSVINSCYNCGDYSVVEDSFICPVDTDLTIKQTQTEVEQIREETRSSA